MVANAGIAVIEPLIERTQGGLTFQVYEVWQNI